MLLDSSNNIIESSDDADAHYYQAKATREKRELVLYNRVNDEVVCYFEP